MTEEIRRATAATLRKLAEWRDSDGRIDTDREELYAIAEQVEAMDGSNICCPVCQEVTCDTDCPLAPVRAQDDARDEGAAA